MLDTDNPKTEEELDAWLNSIQNEPTATFHQVVEPAQNAAHPYSFKKEENPLKNYLSHINHSTPLANFSLLVLQGFEMGFQGCKEIFIGTLMQVVVNDV
jgi:hypothetical protein